MESTTTPNLNEALAGLLHKYAVDVSEPWRLDDRQAVEAVSPGTLLLASACHVGADHSESAIPLRPWQCERRFQELKNLVDSQTITPVLMCRFACITDGATLPLDGILHREFDLVEWLGGSPIVTVYAAFDGERAANAIVRLDSGVVCSVEAGTTLPAGALMHDRHEMIARRGVASDRVVDTQVAQSSVYVWSDSGSEAFTDVDAELTGLDAGSVALVRAAYETLSQPEVREELRSEHERLRNLVALARESNRQQKRLRVEGRSS